MMMIDEIEDVKMIDTNDDVHHHRPKDVDHLHHHDENVVRHLADRVIVIEGGKVAAQGTVEDLEAKGLL